MYSQSKGKSSSYTGRENKPILKAYPYIMKINPRAQSITRESAMEPMLFQTELLNMLAELFNRLKINRTVPELFVAVVTLKLMNIESF